MAVGKIKVTKAPIDGLYVIEPTVFGDNRGYFVETYNQQDMHEAGLDMVFVQDNQSMSTKGVLRGLHFQKQHPQGKLVRAIRGEVFDVAVDLRRSSPTFGRYVGVGTIITAFFMGPLIEFFNVKVARPMLNGQKEQQA